MLSKYRLLIYGMGQSTKCGTFFYKNACPDNMSDSHRSHKLVHTTKTHTRTHRESGNKNLLRIRVRSSMHAIWKSSSWIYKSHHNSMQYTNNKW